MAGGENPAVIQATLRHTRLEMTMYYSHACKRQKRAAQGMVLEAIFNGAGGNAAVMSVDREVVYNEVLGASVGRLTQR
jgi:hypothetical protein